MKVRAKFYVASVKITQHSDILEMSAVYGGSTNAEDNTFAKASPSGSLTLQIDNPDIRGKFKPGDVYYLDFTPVPVPAQT